MKTPTALTGVCPNCGVSVTRQKHRVETLGMGFACRSCRKGTVTHPCLSCGAQLKRTGGEVQRNSHYFCDQECRKRHTTQVLWEVIDLVKAGVHPEEAARRHGMSFEAFKSRAWTRGVTLSGKPTRRHLAPDQRPPRVNRK